jgi:hypothetical protein
MSGAGKWIKKNPLAAAAILGVATGGIGLLATPAAAAGGAAAAGLGESLGAAGALEGFGAAGAAAAGAGGAAPAGLGAASLFGPSAGGMGAGLLATPAMPEVALGSTGAFGQFAPMAMMDNTAPQFAALNARGFNPTAPSWMDKLSAGADKMKPYGDLAKMGMNAMGPQEQPQAPQIAPPQLRGPGQGLSPSPQYGGGGGLYGVDPEEEKRRQYMAYMAQMQGVA